MKTGEVKSNLIEKTITWIISVLSHILKKLKSFVGFFI